MSGKDRAEVGPNAPWLRSEKLGGPFSACPYCKRPTIWGLYRGSFFFFGKSVTASSRRSPCISGSCREYTTMGPFQDVELSHFGLVTPAMHAVGRPLQSTWCILKCSWGLRYMDHGT